MPSAGHLLAPRPRPGADQALRQHQPRRPADEGRRQLQHAMRNNAGDKCQKIAVAGVVDLRVPEDGAENADHQAVLEHEPDGPDPQRDAERESDQRDGGVVFKEEHGEGAEIRPLTFAPWGRPAPPRAAEWSACPSARGTAGRRPCHSTTPGTRRRRRRRTGRRRQKMRQVAAEHGRPAEDEELHHAAPVDAGLAVNEQIRPRHEVVEVADGHVAADEGLGLVEIGGGAAVEVAKLDGLVLVEAGQPASLGAFQQLLQPLPGGATVVQESG